MSEPEKLPEIAPSAFRDHGTSERVTRIWQRLEGDLGNVRPRARTVMWWAPAAVVIIFGCGVFVGARWSEPSSMEPAILAPEPQLASEPASAPGLPVPARAEQHAQHRRKKSNPTGVPVAREELEVVVTQELAPAVTPSTPVFTGPPEWERLANLAEYTAAWRALEQAGGFEAALTNATAEQAMLLHDTARFTGQRSRAIQALRHVVDRHPGDPYAPTAAYTLGNMLDRAGDHAGAAEAFAVYRRLAPKGDFVEDALSRQIDVAIQQRNVELARRLADQYAKEFPNGRRLVEIRKQIAQLTGTLSAVPHVPPDAARISPEDKPSEESAEDDTTPPVRAP